MHASQLIRRAAQGRVHRNIFGKWHREHEIRCDSSLVALDDCVRYRTSIPNLIYLLMLLSICYYFVRDPEGFSWNWTGILQFTLLTASVVIAHIAGEDLCRLSHKTRRLEMPARDYFATLKYNAMRSFSPEISFPTAWNWATVELLNEIRSEIREGTIPMHTTILNDRQRAASNALRMATDLNAFGLTPDFVTALADAQRTITRKK